MSLFSVLLESDDIGKVSFHLRDKGLLYDNGGIDFEGLNGLSKAFFEPLIEKLLYLFRVRTIREFPFRDLRRRSVYGIVGSPAI